MAESVEKWIEKKLDDGVSEERIKKTLKETGRDPGLVDEVQSPFEGKEDTEKPSSGEEDEEETVEMEGSGEESGFDSLSFVDNDDKEDNGSEDEIKEKEDDESQGGYFSLPSVSLPSINLGRKKLLLVALVLLIAGTGYTGFSFFETSSIPDISSPLGPSCTEGVGVKLYNAGASGEETVAEVYTDQEAEMVLEVYSGEEKMGEGTRTINGRGVIRADAIGDRAVFHEKGCEEPFSETRY